MAVSQRTIAEHLDLSIATVSRSLANDAAISPATRARVMSAAEQMGYRSTKLLKVGAERLPRGSSKPASVRRARPTQIGVLLRTGQDAAYQDQRLSLLEGLTAAARETGVQLLIDSLLPGDPQRILDNPKQFPFLTGPAAPQGLLLWQFFKPDVLAHIAKLRPCVLINNNYAPGIRVDAVGPNHFDGIIQLVEHLHQLGHRRIGYLGPLHQSIWGHQRASAFVAALYKLGLEDRPDWRIDCEPGKPDASQDRYAHAVRLTQKQGITAWVAGHEQPAHQLQSTLMAAGISIPGQVSIAAFHSHRTPPGLLQTTAMNAPWRDIGHHALRRLLSRLQQPQEPGRRVLLDCQLHPGQTVAEPLGA